MPLLKPLRPTQLNRTHPLARSIAVCWLLNEGSGNTVFDSSGNGCTGKLQGSPSWVAGHFGHTLYYDGESDSLETATPAISSAAVSVSFWFKPAELQSTKVEDGTLLIQRTVGDPYASFRVRINNSDDKILLLIYNSSGVLSVSIGSDSAVQAGVWYHAAFILDSNYNARMYVNGVQQASTGNSGSLYNANGVLRLGSRTGTVDNFKGMIDLVMIFNRVLSASEITLLCREPFCMFKNPTRPEWILAHPTAISLAGSTSAQSTVSGSLGSLLSSTETERDWLRASLFDGLTSNAFKLGTTLSLGWFWQRTAGCSALYRGPSIARVDFTDILTVGSLNAKIISPANYVPHDCDLTYFYVIGRFNSCGYRERTLAAVAKVSINADGELMALEPNSVLASRVEQTRGNRILLSWFYCPLEQKSQPVRFNVYYDNQVGQINYETPLASIDCLGYMFYEYHSDALAAGRYLLAVRAEDANGTESSSSVQLSVQVNATSLDPIEILSADCR